MSKKLINLCEQRRKRKPRLLDEVAKIAFRDYCDPEFLKALGEEPVGLASGKTNVDCAPLFQNRHIHK